MVDVIAGNFAAWSMTTAGLRREERGGCTCLPGGLVLVLRLAFAVLLLSTKGDYGFVVMGVLYDLSFISSSWLSVGVLLIRPFIFVFVLPL